MQPTWLPKDQAERKRQGQALDQASAQGGWQSLSGRSGEDFLLWLDVGCQGWRCRPPSKDPIPASQGTSEDSEAREAQFQISRTDRRRDKHRRESPLTSRRTQMKGSKAAL